MNCFYRTNICTGTTICANIGINLINITFGYCFNRTFIDAGTASDAIFIYYMSHDTNKFNEYYFAGQMYVIL